MARTTTTTTRTGGLRRIMRFSRNLALGTLATALTVGAAQPVFAQDADNQNNEQRQRFQRGGPGGGGGFGGQWWRNRERLTDREIYRMAEYLEFDDGQMALTMAMFDSFEQAYQAEEDAVRQRFEDARDQVRESGEWTNMMSRMVQIGTESEARVAALEQSFLDDVQETVLTEGQQEKWASYERDRRRRATLEQGAQISGEGVDLFEVVDEIEIDPESRKRIAGTLESYSVELDHALVERNQFVTEVMGRFEDVLSNQEGQDPESVFRKQNEKRETIRNINASYAQLIADQLGGEQGRAFLDEFNQTAYPRVYTDTEVEPYVEKVRSLSSLTETQEQSINAIYSDYQEKMRNLNKQLVSLQNKQDQERQRMMFEGMRMMYSQGPRAARENMRDFWRNQMGGDDEQEISDPADLLRRERRDLETTTLDAFVAVLSTQQIEEAPRPQPEAERERRQQEREERMREWRQRMEERRDRRGGGG